MRKPQFEVARTTKPELRIRAGAAGVDWIVTPPGKYRVLVYFCVLLRVLAWSSGSGVESWMIKIKRGREQAGGRTWVKRAAVIGFKSAVLNIRGRVAQRT